jgi:hypothetical protein
MGGKTPLERVVARVRVLVPALNVGWRDTITILGGV